MNNARTGVAAVLAAVIATACGPSGSDFHPAGGYGDPFPAPFNDPQISVLDEELRPWLVFQPAVLVREPDRPLQVQVPVRNLAQRKYLLDYRFLFYDDDGVEQTPAMGWTMFALEPKQVVRLQAGALDVRATRYRLELKWAK